jgi:hypothetical protein
MPLRLKALGLLKAAADETYDPSWCQDLNLKNWLQSFRRDKQGIYTPTQATLDWLEKTASGTASHKITRAISRASFGASQSR